jgi:hypothetical protein
MNAPPDLADTQRSQLKKHPIPSSGCGLSNVIPNVGIWHLAVLRNLSNAFAALILRSRVTLALPPLSPSLSRIL